MVIGESSVKPEALGGIDEGQGGISRGNALIDQVFAEKSKGGGETDEAILRPS